MFQPLGLGLVMCVTNDDVVPSSGMSPCKLTLSSLDSLCYDPLSAKRDHNSFISVYWRIQSGLLGIKSVFKHQTWVIIALYNESN